MASVSNYFVYITAAGDTWDEIAYKACGNECLSSELMLLNRQHIGTVIFDEGIELIIPVYEESQDPETLPPWRDADA